MAASSPTQATASLLDGHDGYVEQVQQVLRANRLDFGTPFDFLTLAKTLEDDSRLRNDLVFLLRSFMEEENNVSLQTVLSILAIASGGPDLATSDGDSSSQPISDPSQPVNTLVDLLINVGGRSPANIQIPNSHSDISNSEPINNEAHQAVVLSSSSSDHEVHLEPFDDASDESTLEADATRSDQDSPLRTGAENSLVESLIRLELNALQVKHYLDSIDQRISRIEPRLDSLPTHVPSPAAPHPEPASGSGYGHTPDGRYSALLATETLPHHSQGESSPPAPHPAQTGIPPEMSSLLQRSSRQNLLRKKSEIPIITAAAIVLLLLGYWGFSQSTPSTTIDPVNPALSQNAIPQSNPTPANDTTFRSSENATRPPSPNHAATPKALTARAQNYPSRNSTPTHFNASPPSSTTTTPATSADPEESSDPSSLTTQPINVSSGVMAANVLSAPQPSYPMLASLTRMQGEVVMQAIIAKDGTIENVRVIKGHRLLRGAATNAVRSWRYRPYLVNGRPVEVATTVSVDFKRQQ